VSAADPRVVWDALEAGGYGPHGELHDFRSRCPGHDGDNPTSLHVTLGGDGALLLCCHAYDCPVDEIRERIGVRWGDLFPSDRAYDGRGLAQARREDFAGHLRTAANIMHAAQVLDAAAVIEIKLAECPCCESSHAAIVFPAGADSFTHCPRGCGVEAMTGGLAALLAERRGRR
jgi:hypothetical protein